MRPSPGQSVGVITPAVDSRRFAAALSLRPLSETGSFGSACQPVNGTDDLAAVDSGPHAVNRGTRSCRAIETSQALPRTTSIEATATIERVHALLLTDLPLRFSDFLIGPLPPLRGLVLETRGTA